MRDIFDQRLTDPTAEEVARVLGAAVEAVNANRTAGNLPAPTGASSVGERVVREPEGRDAYFGSGNPEDIARLSLVWWTNTTGHKFVRVRGWRERDPRGAPPALAWQVSPQALAFQEAEKEHARRPLIWHLEPQRVIETFTAGDPEWVVVCGCGAAGSPVSLAWQNGMCGPCADRVAEYGPTSVTHALGLLTHPDFEPTEVVFTPDGKFVAAFGRKLFAVWNITTGTKHPTGLDSGITPELPPSISPNGQFVFLNDRDPVVFWQSFAEGQVRAPVPFVNDIRAAHWTGRENELLVQARENHSLELFDALDGTRTAPVAPPDSGARLYAVWPDARGPRAVFATAPNTLFGANPCASVARVNADGSLAVEARFKLGDGRLNRTGLWHAGPELVRFTPDGERLLFIRGDEMELRLPSRPKALVQVTFPLAIRDLAFSPDYEHLYVLGADGAIYVCNPGTLTSIRARLRWHIGAVSRMALSPDGSMIATAGAEGVKLWPVSQLLPLLE